MGDTTPRNIGLPMLIVVLVSICLFSFSGIAYSTARHSLEQSNALIKRTKDYYGACNEAEEKLSALTEIPEGETTFSFPFGTGMDELQVKIRPDGNGQDYKITGWIISDTASWEAPEENGNKTHGPKAPGKASGPQPPSN